MRPAAKVRSEGAWRLLAREDHAARGRCAVRNRTLARAREAEWAASTRRGHLKRQSGSWQRVGQLASQQLGAEARSAASSELVAAAEEANALDASRAVSQAVFVEKAKVA